MRLYVYNHRDGIHVATIDGHTGTACEQAYRRYYDPQTYGSTHALGIGAQEMVVFNPDAEYITVESL